MGLKITTAANNLPVMWLYGVIGEALGGISAAEFREALDSIPSGKEMELRIHSEGGSYVDSIAMHSNLVRRKGKVNVVVDGLAASGGSIVAMAGANVEMAEGSWMMIHEAYGAMEGRADDFRAAAERLDQTNAELVRIYSKRWKGDEAELRKALADETWLNADESVGLGLADSVSASMAVAAHADWSKFGYRAVPQPLLEVKAVFPRLAMAGETVDELFAEESLA